MTSAQVPDGAVLVDTDVATWLLTGGPHSAPWLPLLRGRPILLSFIGVGELFALPHARRWQEQRRTNWETRIQGRFTVVPFSANLARVWAPMHVKYSGHLKRGGANDLWVAATALSADPPLPLATGNLSDFDKVAADHPLQIIHPDRAPTA